MSASTQIAVLLENDVLVSCDETDAITVEGSTYKLFGFGTMEFLFMIA